MSARAAKGAATNGAPLGGLVRLEPRDGLVIDAEAWLVAHAYHDQTAFSHNLAAHGYGVLAGLEVVPAGGRRLGVLPGISIDPAGRLMVNPSPVRVEIEDAAALAGLVLIVLRRADADPDDDGRIKEEAIVQAVGVPPEEPYVELARVDLGAQGSFAAATDPARPKPGEIDLRFRPIAGGHARGDVTVADLALPSAGEGHAGGGALLARAINVEGSFRARYAGELRPGDTIGDITILYASGNKEFTLNEGTTSWLKSFLEGGGSLIGDGCHAAPADPFGAAFDKLGKAIGRQLKRVVTGDRILWAHNIFGAPPPGLVKTDVGLILAGGGVVYCASDYGCMLSGAGESPPARAAIRAVEEFAANLAASARERALALSLVE
ncbi:MAG: hypothetical protein ACRDJH_24200 [Thermomicrobiales bacterium]